MTVDDLMQPKLPAQRDVPKYLMGSKSIGILQNGAELLPIPLCVPPLNNFFFLILFFITFGIYEHTLYR